MKPAIIFGDLSRPKAMTVEWIKYAQGLTDKVMKGMLTGPVTMLMWSFPREDVSRKEQAQQLALAIRDEVVDLEKAGIKIVQIDEAAFREGLPLRRAQWQEYLDTQAAQESASAASYEDQSYEAPQTEAVSYDSGSDAQAQADAAYQNYLDAQAAADAFGHQFRKLAVRECKGENSEEASSKRGFFDYLYYLGIERIIIDNGWYRAHFRRNEIVAPPNWAEDKKMPPANPALAFSMLDFLGEVRWPVKYEKRMQVLQAKELRMLSLAMVGHYIVPIQHEGPAEVMEDGRIHFNKDTKLKFPVMKNAEGKIFLPVFTDGVEFSKKFGKDGFEGGVFGFQDVLRFIQDKEGFVINPMGQNIMIPKDRILALQAAAQAAEAAKAADPAVQTGQETAQKDKLSETEDAAKNATAENTADTVK